MANAGLRRSRGNSPEVGKKQGSPSMNIRQRTMAISASIVFAFSLHAAANAKGVTLVQQSNGNVKTYSNVFMALHGQRLTLRSADRKGVLEILTGACSFTQEVRRCLPYAVMLTQHGRTRTIALAYGTVYLNLMRSAGRLPMSSRMLAPRTALVLLKTVRGTYITVKGALDEVTL